jgi:hypothetical protein
MSFTKFNATLTIILSIIPVLFIADREIGGI